MWFRATPLAIFLCGIFLSCARIGDFTEPYMSEVFLGNCTITPSVKGIASSAVSVCSVGLEGDPSGRTITIHGIPTNEPFPIIPDKLYDFIHKGDLVPNFSPTISGFAADVIDKRTLKVTGFASPTDAKDLGFEATGTILRQGPQIATSAKDPIIIRVRVGALSDMIPDLYLENMRRIEDDTPVTELDDDEMIPLYRIDFRPEIMTVF